MFFNFLSHIFVIEISVEPCVEVFGSANKDCITSKFIIMITLEKLVEELDVYLIDEVIGGRPGTWWDPWTSAGGTSGNGGPTDTTRRTVGCWFCGSDGE